MALVKQIWSSVLSGGTITIDENYGFTEISIILLSGTGTLIGSSTANGISSSPITLPLGIGINVGSGTTLLITGITITTTGQVAILGR